MAGTVAGPGAHSTYLELSGAGPRQSHEILVRLLQLSDRKPWWTSLAFPDALRLIDERSIAFRAAVDAAPGLDARVPSCPEWTLLDLAQHLGGVHYYWAAVVRLGPADVPPADSAAEAPHDVPRERHALLSWLAAATQELLDALRATGPDRGCWTLPVGVALDDVEEFLLTCGTTTSPWPHQPSAVDYRASEGRAWRLWLSAAGARAARIPPDGIPSTPPDTAVASAFGAASDLVLALYGRSSMDSLKLEGDPRLFDQLTAWEPDD
jgi:mycothiol maleylpyruvate isomerase-like protein/MDMPI-like protein